MMSKKILAIDDEADVLLQVEFILKKNGYDVVTASDGKDGWELINKEKPDLVLLDLILPGIEGVEIAKRMKSSQELKATPIILLTASADSINQKMQETRADDYLLKPFEYSELLKKIKERI